MAYLLEFDERALKEWRKRERAQTYEEALQRLP